jgi:hypothetical protein
LPATLVLLALSLLSACATTQEPSHPRRELRLSRAGGPGFELENGYPADPGSSSGVTYRGELDDKAWEEARRAEADRALETLWSVAGTTNALGAEWEFRFWSEGGALTLLSLRHTEVGEGLSAPLSRGAFLPGLSRELPNLLGSNPREVSLTLEREETGWSADFDTSSQKEPPPYAWTIPSVRGGTSGLTHQQVLDTARGIARLMSVPRGGSAELVAHVSLEDGRILGWEPEDLDSSGDGPALSAGEDAVNLVVAVLLPFTRALGERTVSLSLQAEHRHGEARPRWRILAAHVVKSPPLPAEVADIHQEYRQLHESILIEFQEQTREYAVLAAGFTLEQIAYSIVGGLALKGAWGLIGKGAPTIVSVLSKGGKVAVSWFRNLLARTPAADRELLLRLWMRAETQGLKALTEVEKQELRAVMGRMEKVLETPLDDSAKRQIWKWSREEYFSLYNLKLAEILGAEGMTYYQVHHICPMRFVHLFPKLDINGKANLTGIHKAVHESISSVWSSLGRASDKMSAKDVSRVIEIVNRHYRRWFDKVFDPKDLSALANAEQRALSEVAALKSLIP